MNIVLGQEPAHALSSKYVVLPLDTFQIDGHQEPVMSYCVVETASLSDLAQLDTLRELHNKLISNYHIKNWSFCEQAIEHLSGRWNGELDSFYVDLLARISEHRLSDPGPEWSPVINRRSKSVSG